MHSMICRERNLRYSILNGGTGRAQYDHSVRAGDHLLKLLMTDGDDSSSAREAKGGLTPSELSSEVAEVADDATVDTPTE
eukprot:12886607-Alexandrium_andersonii.AAC.1